MHIMVVDDEPDIQILFEQRFRKEIKRGEMHFRFAFSGQEALGVIDGEGGADLVLILSDIHMPGMSGLDLLHEIRQRRPKLPVIMITAFGDQANQEDALSRGADGYIHKPIDFAELKETMIAVGKKS
ncbi:MAG: response regulator [Candidatus Hydrogenedentes bacterium]|jgi:CheY-like chemotaxis protein|nr:response regulator [Candidatus Hydrogenedentota bacterium]